MIVKELIKKLNTLNPNAEIFIANANDDSDGVDIIEIENNNDITYFLLGDFS